MGKVVNENYLQIHGWMLNELNLKGNELLVYAIIYGFTQDGDNWFEGSRQYLADWCGCTTTGIQKNLSSLLKKGLIIKEYTVINGVKFCKYKTSKQSLHPDNKVNGGSKQSLLGVDNSVNGGSKQSYHNNIDNNTSIYTRDNKKESKKETQASFNELIDEYTSEENLREELKNHLKTRKLKKAALTNRAIQLSLKTLDDLVKGYPVNEQNDVKIKIVQQSIEKGWIGFFGLKEESKKKESGWDYLNNEYNKINDIF